MTKLLCRSTEEEEAREQEVWEAVQVRTNILLPLENNERKCNFRTTMLNLWKGSGAQGGTDGLGFSPR